MNNDQNKIKPILRWAGGKNWLVKHLNQLIPQKEYNNYHEPFLGGASIFLSLNPNKKSFLSDLNEELIRAYKAIKSDPEGIINIMRKFKNTEDFYYNISGSDPTII